MKKDTQHLPDNQVATQRNDLLRGQQSLSLVQKRIFALAIQQIKRDDEKLKPYTIEIQDLVNAGGSRDVFNQIEGELDSLMKKILLKKEKIEESKKPKTTRWAMITKAVHNPGDGTLTIRIHEEIKQMLIKLKEQGNFTPVPVAEMLACRSSYGQRMYELLYSQRWKETGKWEVSVEDLRFSLDVEDKYKNFSGFRRRVLQKAQKDLQKHTNMRFDWEAESRGKGRKITHLIFEFSFIPGQMDLALEQPESRPELNLNYNLAGRLKENAGLSQHKINKVGEWLDKNPRQQKPLSYWLHEKVECPNPEDSGGNPIREMDAWAWANLQDRMNDGGFPSPDDLTPEKSELTPDIQPDESVDDSKNPFKKMFSSFIKNE